MSSISARDEELLQEYFVRSPVRLQPADILSIRDDDPGAFGLPLFQCLTHL
jgi:hypothetical protein